MDSLCNATSYDLQAHPIRLRWLIRFHEIIVLKYHRSKKKKQMKILCTSRMKIY